MRYSQGWLVGQNGTDGYMVPFEICLRRGGNYNTTSTGPLNDDLLKSFVLCSFVVQHVLHDMDIHLEPYDCHLNFPLHGINGSGFSCRLSFTYTLLEALGIKLPFPASSIALTGDLNLNGDVLPVKGISQKIKAVREAGFNKIIVADKQPEECSLMIRINHLNDLIRRQT
ncbi:S16 family serine protease (plasmid) [Bacillus wiedmannii]|uniref:S16 family serine protease n=1 Tax=Bacillus wiedmannii TaxID=1890302 RepID=UPI00288356BC|nr:S16 family serine protease [Bacillus wiedmannii]WMS85383.1 S16 family serine protease [Bacillus wiedmannii]